MELISYHGGSGIVVDLDSPYVVGGEGGRARLRHQAGLYSRRGSIPVVSTFHDLLGIDTYCLVGVSTTTTRIARNEVLARGSSIAESVARWDEIGKMKKSS